MRCADALAQPSMLLPNREFRKRWKATARPWRYPKCDRATIQIPFVPADEAKRLADSLDAGDARVL